jgi:hypothetical protein
MIPLFYLELQMPPKKKTKEISKTDRESTKEATAERFEPLEHINNDNLLSIKLTPVQMQQISILATVAHNEDPAVYCQKVIARHIADRLYLVTK